MKHTLGRLAAMLMNGELNPFIALELTRCELGSWVVIMPSMPCCTKASLYPYVHGFSMQTSSSIALLLFQPSMPVYLQNTMASRQHQHCGRTSGAPTQPAGTWLPKTAQQRNEITPGGNVAAFCKCHLSRAVHIPSKGLHLLTA